MYKPKDTIKELARIIAETTLHTCNTMLLDSEAKRIAKLIEINRHGIYDQVQYEHDCADVRSRLAKSNIYFPTQKYVDAVVHEYQSGYDCDYGTWDNIDNAIERVENLWNIGLATDEQNFDIEASQRLVGEYLARKHPDEYTDDFANALVQVFKDLNGDSDRALYELTKGVSSFAPFDDDDFLDAIYKFVKEN